MFTIRGARINANGAAQLHGIAFIDCTLVWETGRTGVVLMKDCTFMGCTYLVNGMAVSWAEFVALVEPR